MKRQTPARLLLGAFLTVGLAANAATSTWSGAGGNPFWTTALNWDAAPGSGANIVFPSVANSTVNLNAATYPIGTLTFNSPGAYSLGNGALTLGGNFEQNGAGAVTLDADLGLGGASRVFGGSGSGVVTFNNPVTGGGGNYNLIVGAGNYVIANNRNEFNQLEVATGAKVTMIGTQFPTDYPWPSYFGNGFFAKVNGGTLDYRVNSSVTKGGFTYNYAIGWAGHGLEFGPDGGTLLMTNNLIDRGPFVFRSSCTNAPGTVVVNTATPFTGTGYNGWPGPWYEEIGWSTAKDEFYPSEMYRQGSGDVKAVITNGATVWLNWSYMTNGNLIIQGHPGGDSSVIETNALGTTRNVGRFGTRKIHQGPQWGSLVAGVGSGTYNRAFYLEQPYQVKFYDATQIFAREGVHALACDMSFENGSSVDICGGKTDGSRMLILGWYATDRFPGDTTNAWGGGTNTLTIKSGGKLNLNLQMRTAHTEGGAATNGASAGLQVMANTVIQDDGQLKLYRSQTNCLIPSTYQDGVKSEVRCIEIFRPITGQGSSASDARVIVQLPYSNPSGSGFLNGGGGGSNGVNFDGIGTSLVNCDCDTGFPGAALIVNGTGNYGLRLIGQGNYLDNLIGTPGSAARNRMESLTGSGGVLTIAATNISGQMTLSSGPTTGNPGSVGLAFAGNIGHNYNLQPGTIANFSRLLLKSGRVTLNNGFVMAKPLELLASEGAATVVVPDGATATMGVLAVLGNATLQMGSGGGSGAILRLANSAATAWTAGKTLTISNWNGSASGGGSDQIFAGTDATGLTAGQLAQIKWINPFGGGDMTATKILATGEIVPSTFVTPPVIGAPAVVGGNLVFNVVAGSPSQVGVVECATNLTLPVIWVNVVTNTGNFGFTNNINVPKAFYRVRVQ